MMVCFLVVLFYVFCVFRDTGVSRLLIGHLAPAACRLPSLILHALLAPVLNCYVSAVVSVKSDKSIYLTHEFFV